MHIMRVKIFILFILITGGSQAATVTLDQSNEGGVLAAYAVIGTQSVAQTFTVGLDGFLSQVDLAVGMTPDATDGFYLQIYNTASGAPDTNGPSLFSQYYDATSLPLLPATNSMPDTFASFDLSGAGLSVSSGDELAIVLTRAGDAEYPDWILWSVNVGGYGSGAAHTLGRQCEIWCATNSGGNDMLFKTYVSNVPVPAAAWLFGSALAGLGWMRRKQTV
jgi:hypothetical protein